LILVIDTALAACQAGLYRDGAALSTRSEPMTRGHQEALGPMVETLFRDTQTSPRDLTAIGVTLGPGSFTGLRVGLSFAKGMASGLSLNLQGVGTLEALLRHPGLTEDALAAIDGGRGRFYVQLRAEAHSFEAEGLVALARAASVTTLTGPAADRAADLLPGLHVVAQAWPSLDAIAELTAVGGHDDVTPLYMREADAVASRRGIISLSDAG
jgi:tRNA threonylcarbamoyladenosine biosynthesis protein TsaB